MGKLLRCADRLLLPRGSTGNVWELPSYQSSAKVADIWSAGFVVISNVVLIGSLRTAPLPALFRLMPSVWIATAVIQLSCMWNFPTTYMRYRHLMHGLSRLSHLLAVAYLPHMYRTLARSPSGMSTFVSDFTATRNPHIPAPWAAASFGMSVSAATADIIHSTGVPLPFPPSLLFHTAHFLILLAFQTAPTLLAISLSPLKPEFDRLCGQLNALTGLLTQATCHQLPNCDFLARSCNDHAPLLLVLFAYTYFTFVLPVYMSYRMEHKWSFTVPLHHPSPTSSHPPTTPPKPQGAQPPENPSRAGRSRPSTSPTLPPPPQSLTSLHPLPLPPSTPPLLPSQPAARSTQPPPPPLPRHQGDKHIHTSTTTSHRQAPAAQPSPSAPLPDPAGPLPQQQGRWGAAGALLAPYRWGFYVMDACMLLCLAAASWLQVLLVRPLLMEYVVWPL